MKATMCVKGCFAAAFFAEKYAAVIIFATGRVRTQGSAYKDVSSTELSVPEISVSLGIR